MSAPLYTVDEVATRLHKSRRWLLDFLRARDIGRLAGRTRLFTDIDFERLRLAILHAAIDKVGRQSTPSQGHVYFIQSGDFIKIGYTSAPVARVVKMLTDSPLELRMLHIEQGTFKQEKVFHRNFAAIRERGEWFRKTPELLEFIEQRKRIKAGEA